MKYRLSLLIGCLAVLLGVFTFASCNKKDKNDPDSGYSIVGSWRHYEVNKEGEHTEIVTFKSDETGTWSVSEGNGTTVYTLTYSFNSNTNEGNLMMIYTDPGTREKSYYPMNFKIKWFGTNNIVMSTRMDGDTEWTDDDFERQ